MNKLLNAKCITYTNFLNKFNTEKILDNLNKKTIDIKLDSEKYKKEFNTDNITINSDSGININTIKDNINNIIDIIQKNTTIIKLSDFLINLYELFDDIITDINNNKNKNIFIFIDDNKKIKSNYWIASVFVTYINNNNEINKNNIYFVEIIDIKYISPSSDSQLLPSQTQLENINMNMNDSILIYFDDCIYSGKQMSNHTNNLYNYIRSFDDFKLDIYIITPYITTIGKATINKTYKYIYHPLLIPLHAL